MSAFKRNPAQYRPAYFMVTPHLFEALVEELADRELLELARRRLADRDAAVEVDIDQRPRATGSNSSPRRLPSGRRWTAASKKFCAKCVAEVRCI